MPKLNILFIVNGEGLGNIHRSLFVCDFLAKKNHSITIATSAQAYEKMKLLERYQTLKIQSMPYAQSLNGQINFLKTFSHFFNWIKILLHNSKQLEPFYKNADIIFVDSEYTIALLKVFKRSKALIISINNAANILQAKNWKYFRFKLIPSFWIEFFDYFFNMLFADQVIIPTLPGQTKFKGKFKSIPAFTRFTISDYTKRKSQSKKNIFIVPSSSKFQYGWEFLDHVKIADNHQYYTLGFKVKGQPSFTELPKSFNLAQFTDSIDLIITRGGLTTLSEAVTLEAPTLILPFPNHFEQVVNAYDAQQLGYGLILDPDKFSENVAQALNLNIDKSINREEITHILNEIVKCNT